MNAKPEDAFVQLLRQLNKVENSTKRAALAMQIFGESGVQFMPLINDATGGLDDLMSEARELGIVLTDEQARQAQEVEGSFVSMNAEAQGLIFGARRPSRRRSNTRARITSSTRSTHIRAS